jgi:AraC family transcriptional regulator, regulatory protein of adaptative response / methylated-DNA-[protein]-cysteine methyltransferase
MLMSIMSRIDEAQAWTDVLSRDAKRDGALVYAVGTTGIYCRPSCPSRRPRRENVRFFSSAGEAEKAGFRPCRRCQPEQPSNSTDTALNRARSYIDLHLRDLTEERITLSALSVESGLSPYHLQRKFKARFGLTPAQYMRVRKSELLKEELKRGETVSRATYGAGYGSSSRAYSAANSHLGMTPAAYRRGGAGMQIDYVIARTSLGTLLVAATERGVCAVKLGDDVAALESALATEYPRATRARITAPASSLGIWVAEIVATLDGERSRTDVPLDVEASAFQWKVWRELQKIPFGETRTYSDVANAIGAPRAARSVASACARNPVALLIPCHRVVRRGGALGGYRWGLDRKQRLLERERSAPEGSKPSTS